MNQVVPLPRREPLTKEDHLDRWNVAQREFMRAPDEEAKETMLARFAGFYRSMNSGSSVGLDEELERLEARADQMLAAEEARNRSNGNG